MSRTSSQRSDRTARLLRIWSLLARTPHGLTVHEIADRCEISIRTVYRDINALDSQIRVPILQEGNRYSVDSSALPPVRFSLEEAMALYISARLASRYADERDQAISSVFHKLAEILPPPISERVAETAKALAERPANETYSKVFGILASAWALRRRVRIGYLWTKPDGSARRVYTRYLDPYFIEPSGTGHSCYVIGLDHYSSQIRTFKIERIREAELTPEMYEMPAGWSASEYLKGAWGIFHDDEVEVRIRFSRSVAAALAEAIWHPSQEIVEETDGNVLYTARVAGIVEITPWILSWGAEAEVLSPPALRDAVASAVHRLSALYSPGPPADGGSPNVIDLSDVASSVTA